MSPKHKGYFFNFRIFFLKLMYFRDINEKKNCYFHYNEKLNKIFLSDLAKLIEYSAFAVNEVLPNSCVHPLTRIEISLFLLLACTDELISATKIIAFFSQSKFGIEISERESNPIPCPE